MDKIKRAQVEVSILFISFYLFMQLRERECGLVGGWVCRNFKLSCILFEESPAQFNSTTLIADQPGTDDDETATSEDGAEVYRGDD